MVEGHDLFRRPVLSGRRRLRQEKTAEVEV
jgi:hypothetical protein